jgi:acyl-CoA reductase-like NAD-dependent aldehyde dehydrogenase
VVSLELGGKSPTIVFEDANIEEAVKASTYSITWSESVTSSSPVSALRLALDSGQICGRGNSKKLRSSAVDLFAS